MVKVKMYTSAPNDYDAFGTRRVRLAGHDGGKEVWEVDVHPEHEAWQRGRYFSGCHSAYSAEVWGQLLARGMATAPATKE